MKCGDHLPNLPVGWTDLFILCSCPLNPQNYSFATYVVLKSALTLKCTTNTTTTPYLVQLCLDRHLVQQKKQTGVRMEKANLPMHLHLDLWCAMLN